MADALVAPTRLWISTDHAAHWPVGVASIVMANSEEEARMYLDQALRENSLNPAEGYTLIELNISMPFARVLADGNY